MAHAAYLYQVNQTYYFRIRIPKDLKEWFRERQDFKRSLKTKSLTSAKALCNLWAGKTERLFTMIRTGTLKDSQIKKLVSEYLEETLAMSDDLRVSHGSRLVDCEGYFDTAAPYSEFIERASRDIHSGSWEYIGPIVDSFLEGKGIRVEKDSTEYKKLCRDIALVHIEALKIDERRDFGDFSDEHYGKASEEKVSAGMPVQPGKEGLKFSELVQQYLKEGAAKKKWTGKSFEQVSSRLSLFLEILGDVEVKGLVREDFVDCLNSLRKIPSNRSKRKPYRDMSVQKILSLQEPVENPLSERTIKHHIELLSSLFKWAVLQGYAEKNLVEGLAPRISRAADQERLPYALEELQKIVSLIPDEAKGGKPERRWIPLIGMYAGMRLDEICQLHREDICQIDGVWCFKAWEDEERKVKSDSGVRIVPVHPKLIELGFLGYVESVDHERLWPNLKKGRDGYSDAFGKWFQRFNRKVITEDRKKVFHSLRHNFTDSLKQAGVQEQLIGELVGHSSGSITMERYGKAYQPKVLLEALERLEYRIV